MNLRAYTLQQRHRLLSRQIEDELKRPAPDSLRLQELKRRRLGLKEQLTAMRSGGFAHA